jgi:DNA-binding CsgD family transcriptional regulator
VLLEREHALDHLQRQLARARQGFGGLALIGGEAGIGKSALVRAFSASLPTGTRVLAGMCDPLSTPRPYGPLHDISAQARGGLGRLRIEEQSREMIFREALAEIGDPADPVILIVEDIHWADSGTLDLLRFLGRRIETTHALVLATFRDDEIGPGHPLQRLLGDLATAAGVHRLTVPPLSEAAVALLTAPRGLDAADLYQLTGGNSFFVTEVLAAGGRGIPATVSDVVHSRAAGLSAPAMAALEAAAVIGPDVDPWLLMDVAACDGAPVEECLAAGLLGASDRRLQWRHELARAAIYDAIPAYRRQALHEQVLAGVQARPENDADPAWLAHHAEEAGDAHAVLAFAPEAGRRADELRAVREATEQYARALRFAAGLPDAERLALMEAYARVSDLSGWGEAGIPLRVEMIELARRCGDRLREADHLGWLTLSLALDGLQEDAESSSRAARALLDDLPEGPTHAWWHAHHAYLHWSLGDVQCALAENRRAIEIARRHDDLVPMLIALQQMGSMRLMTGNEAAGRADLDESARLARDARLDALFAFSRIDLAEGLRWLMRLPEAAGLLSEVILFTSEHGIDSLLQQATASLAEVRGLQGRYQEAADLATQVIHAQLPAFPGFVLPPYTRTSALTTLAKVRFRRGDPEGGEPLDEALRHAPASSHGLRRAAIHAARAEAAWLAGDGPRAAAEAGAVFPEVVALGAPWLIGELAYWQWKAGVLTEPPPRCAEPYAMQIRGEWRAAAAAWSDLGCPYEAARALTESDEEEPLREALAALERLGAQPAAVQVVQRMRELGIARIPRGPRAATRANPANLTARELQVLALLVEGQRNAEIADRLFLSPKTVEHHVGAILGKLGVASRAEAIARARDSNLREKSG